jgi:hypothetical protein
VVRPVSLAGKLTARKSVIQSSVINLRINNLYKVRFTCRNKVYKFISVLIYDYEVLLQLVVDTA